MKSDSDVKQSNQRVNQDHYHYRRPGLGYSIDQNDRQKYSNTKQRRRPFTQRVGDKGESDTHLLEDIPIEGEGEEDMKDLEANEGLRMSIRMKAIMNSMHTYEPVWSLRAQRKAYELHKKHPYYWNARRLSNLFQKRADHVRYVLWMKKIEEDLTILRPDEPLDYCVEEAIEQVWRTYD